VTWIGSLAFQKDKDRGGERERKQRQRKTEEAGSTGTSGYLKRMHSYQISNFFSKKN
jgi:hypothetical protein